MSMDKYMGYRATHTIPERKGPLPEWDIEGTMFYVDLQKQEFRQVDDPYNRMTLGDIPEEGGFTHFLYDTETKNRYLGNPKKGEDVPDNVRIVLVPPLKSLDPEGLALRQGVPVPAQHRREQHLISLAVRQGEKKRKRGKHL